MLLGQVWKEMNSLSHLETTEKKHRRKTTSFSFKVHLMGWCWLRWFKVWNRTSLRRGKADKDQMCQLVLIAQKPNCTTLFLLCHPPPSQSRLARVCKCVCKFLVCQKATHSPWVFAAASTGLYRVHSVHLTMFVHTCDCWWKVTTLIILNSGSKTNTAFTRFLFYLTNASTIPLPLSTEAFSEQEVCPNTLLLPCY